MKTRLFFIIFSIILSFKAYSVSDSTRVLFIGNSITYFNNMPFLFQDIANNKGKNVAVTMYAPGGTGFVNHYIDFNVFDLFRNYKWDIVVLQPGSSESAGVSFLVETTVKRGKVLLDSIYQYNPCAKVFLYQIPYGVPSATSYNTYFSVQSIIKDSVLKMADSLHLQMIAAGECVRAYYSDNQNILLHNSYNDIHPSIFGSYLIATAFYTGIFQENVSGCGFYSSISQDTALKFFTIADTVILNHLPDWRINVNNLHSDFSFNNTGNIVSFTCNSSNYSNVFWDFGDNTTSSVTNPIHTYQFPGIYKVKLISYNNSCIDSISKELQIILTTNELPYDSISEVEVYPNPVFDILYINMDKISININTLFYLYNIEGKLIFHQKLFTKNTEIDVSNIKNGLYFFKINTNNNTIIKKFIKS